jgi:O-antigen/teichoic acid export membrane protein
MIPAFIKKFSGSRKGIKTLGIYTFSNFLSKAISFASLPLFTYILEKKDFGTISLFSATVSFAMPFISLGILYSTSTDYFRLEKKEFASFISSTFYLPVITALLMGLLFLLFYPLLYKVTGFAPLFIWLIPVVVYANFLIEQNLILVRSKEQPVLFLCINIAKIIIELGLALFLIVALHFGWLGRISGIAVSFVLTGVFAVFYLRHYGYLSGKIRSAVIRKEIIYSVPAIVMQVSIFCISMSDRYFINYYYGEERTGVYSVASTFASVLLIFCTALLQFFSPRLYGELSRNASAAVYKRLFLKYAGILILGFAGLAVITPVAYYYLINKGFNEGLSYFYLLLAGNLAWCLAYFMYSFLLYHKAKRKILLLSAGIILISLTVNMLLTKNYAETGAALGSLVNSCCSLLLVYIITYKYFRHNEKSFQKVI